MRRESIEALVFILVALSALAAPVRAEEPASVDAAEPKRTTTVDAAYRNSKKADDQIGVSIVKTAVKEDGNGGINGAQLTGSFTFNSSMNPDATSHNIFLPAAKAGLEVYGGRIKGDETGQNTNSGIVRITGTRDLLLGESWSAIVAAGVQVSGNTSGKALVGTFARPPIQQGVTASATALLEGGAASLSLYDFHTKLIAGIRMEEVLQACQKLDRYDENFLCLSLKAFQRVGTEFMGQIDVSVMYAHKIDDGSQKAYVFIAPAITASEITAGGNSDTSKDTHILQAGGRVGVTF